MERGMHRVDSWLPVLLATSPSQRNCSACTSSRKTSQDTTVKDQRLSSRKPFSSEPWSLPTTWLMLNCAFVFHSGTLHSQEEIQDTSRASIIKDRARSFIKVSSNRSSSASSNTVTVREIMKELKHDPAKLSRMLKTTFLPRMYVVALVLPASREYEYVIHQSGSDPSRLFR
jgi:hypothetical protein